MGQQALQALIFTAWVAATVTKMAPYPARNNPRDVVPESNMPAYPWLEKRAADHALLPAKMAALRTLGAPYSGR